jgi:catechol 2,3-dioxygenase-like lactoylglutathione lyase family enzyme
MAVSRIDHVNIDTAKPEETISFYEAALGLEHRPEARPDPGFPGAWLFSGDQAMVHLNYHQPGSAGAEKLADGSKSGAFNHVAFAGADFAATCARLDELGIPYRTGGHPDRGVRQIFLRDPNNVAIELNIAE